MRVLTREERDLLHSNAEDATIKQLFVLLWWDFVSQKKINAMVDALNEGVDWNFAYKIAKNTK